MVDTTDGQVGDNTGQVEGTGEADIGRAEVPDTSLMADMALVSTLIWESADSLRKLLLVVLLVGLRQGLQKI